MRTARWFTGLDGREAFPDCWACGESACATTWVGGNGLPAHPICGRCAEDRLFVFDLSKFAWEHEEKRA